jgi:hypothetical protein
MCGRPPTTENITVGSVSLEWGYCRQEVPSPMKRSHSPQRRVPWESNNVKHNMYNVLLYCHGPPLWSSSQSTWLQTQRSWFDSRRYQIFWEVMGLERGSLSLMSTTEELLLRKSSSFGLEIREYGRRNPSRWPRGTLYPQKFALTSPTGVCRSAGIVRSRTQTAEFSSF